MLKDIYKKSAAWTALFVVGVLAWVGAIRFLSEAATLLMYKDTYAPDQFLIGLGLFAVAVITIVAAAKVYDGSVSKNREAAMAQPTFQAGIQASAVTACVLYKAEPTEKVKAYIQSLNPLAAMRINEWVAGRITEEQMVQQCAQYDGVDNPVMQQNIWSVCENWKKNAAVADKQVKRIPKMQFATIIVAVVAVMMLLFGMLAAVIAPNKAVQRYAEDEGVHFAVTIVELDSCSIYHKASEGDVYAFTGSNGEEGLIYLSDEVQENGQVQQWMESIDQSQGCLFYGSYVKVTVSDYSLGFRMEKERSIFMADIVPAKDMTFPSYLLFFGYLAAFADLILVAAWHDMVERKYRYLSKL